MAKRSSNVILAEAEIGCILTDRLTQSVEGEAPVRDLNLR
jgi:hypothetical protein